MFITPFKYDNDIIKQIDFINYKDKNKLSYFVEKNKNFYYELNKFIKKYQMGKTIMLIVDIYIFSKCHLHF